MVMLGPQSPSHTLSWHPCRRHGGICASVHLSAPGRGRNLHELPPSLYLRHNRGPKEIPGPVWVILWVLSERDTGASRASLPLGYQKGLPGDCAP